MKHELLRGAETTGGILGFVTWVMFGSAAVSWMVDRITWPALIYAMLSLSVIRMLPVYLCLRGTGIDMAGKLFIGWFGPRGLASIVFAIIVLDEQLPGNDVLMATITCTILLSVIAHGITANPLVSESARGPQAPGWNCPTMISNGMACWIAGLSLIALTIAMHAMSLVLIMLLLGWQRKRVVRSDLSHRLMCVPRS